MDSETEDLKRVQAAIDLLSEHFDTVQVFCTRHEPTMEDGTIGCQRGSGNWYARCGHVREWLVKQDEFVRLGAKDEKED